MKCPDCGEELGLNNICINPLCSSFGSSFDDNSRLQKLQSDLNNTQDSDSNNRIPEYADTKDEDIHSESNPSSFFQDVNSLDNISDQEFEVFFGNKNTDYYLNNLKQYRVNKKFTSWNWPCFLLGPYWLFYRKMFALAFAYLILNCILTFITETPLALFFRIVASVFANNLYIRNCENKIRKIKVSNSNTDLNNYFSLLKKKGSVSIAAPVTLAILSLLIAGTIAGLIILSFIFTPDYNVPNKFSDLYYF